MLTLPHLSAHASDRNEKKIRNRKRNSNQKNWDYVWLSRLSPLQPSSISTTHSVPGSSPTHTHTHTYTSPLALSLRRYANPRLPSRPSLPAAQTRSRPLESLLVAEVERGGCSPAPLLFSLLREREGRHAAPVCVGAHTHTYIHTYAGEAMMG